MKIMDVNEQNDCCVEVVTPLKKKKMKQAQLPFQTRSPIESSPIVRNKKRKLTSPSVDLRSSKVVKVSKKNLKETVTDTKLNDSTNNAPNVSDEDVEVVEDVETENIKENKTLNKVESENNRKTPKRTSTGQKKADAKDKVKSSLLTKFLKKTDKEVDSSNEDDQNSLQIEIDEFLDDSCDAAADKNASKTENNLKNKVEDTSSIANNSLCYDSDSDVEIMSSDNDKEEEENPNEDVEKSIQLDSSSSSTSKTDKVKQRKLTPKQQEKKLMSAKKREERQKLKMEREKRLEEERQNRQREKEEKRKEKKERAKAEKEQKLKEKKLKDLKKQMEIEQKQKERQAKEEERRKKEEAREEEKRKKEEEKLEAERKKQKAASNFTSFFVAKKLEKSIEDETTTEIKNFMPFEVKADMKVAPVCRRILSKEEKLLLDEKCYEENTQISDLYLDEIKNKKIIPRKSYKTWPLEAKEDVVVLAADEENDGSSNIVDQNVVVEKQRTKLLQFSENRRPPYWGTWRKRSGSINPRKPFAKDTQWFNYEVDSDDEWDEEEPGESLHGSDEEKDQENPDDNEYDVDNEFMVPHGYLSDEEVRAEGEDKEDMSPETQKFKLKILGEQFDLERNAKTSKLKPKVIGCIWRGPENTFLENVPQRTVDFLSAHEAWVHRIAITLPTASENEAIPATECGTPTQQQAPGRSKRTRFPKEALPDLIRLVHGNVHGRKFLAKEFSIYWSKKNDVSQSQMPKTSLLNKIREIGTWMACPEEGPMHLKACWYVSEEIRKEYIEEDLTLPNRWSYTLVPQKKKDFTDIAEKLEKEDKEKEKRTVPLITQFTKKITQEEMKKQLNVKPGQSTSPQSSKSAQTKAPKRATLISVARGEQFSKASKDNLLNCFINNNKTVNKDSGKNDGDKVDDVIVVDDEDNEEKVNDEGKFNKKEEEDRLDTVLIECDSETEKEKKKRRDKNGPKLQRDAIDKGAKGTVDNCMVIAIDDSADEN